MFHVEHIAIRDGRGECSTWNTRLILRRLAATSTSPLSFVMFHVEHNASSDSARSDVPRGTLSGSRAGSLERDSISLNVPRGIRWVWNASPLWKVWFGMGWNGRF